MEPSRITMARYVNAYCSRDDFLADLRPARSEEIAAFRAEHRRTRGDWLASDPYAPEPGSGQDDAPARAAGEAMAARRGKQPKDAWPCAEGLSVSSAS